MKSVFPIGTTIYKPGLCSSGYNLFSGTGIVKLVNMNGEVVRRACPGCGTGGG